jgi:raffinose/stachyose/melibiose transport system substrate-binding protein
MAVPPPQGQPGYITFHPDAGMGLNAASTHKAQARIFLEWMTTPKFGALLDNELPGLYSLNNKTTPLKDPHGNQFLALNQGRGTDIRFTWEGMMDGLPDAYSLIHDGTIAVLIDKQTPQQAADSLQEGMGAWFTPAQECR